MTLTEALQRAKKEYVERVLQECEWNISKAALVADCSRDWVYRLIKQHQLKRPAAIPKKGGRPVVVHQWIGN